MVPFFPFHILQKRANLQIAVGDNVPMTRKEKAVMWIAAIGTFTLLGWMFYHTLFINYVPSYELKAKVISYQNERVMFTKYVKVTVQTEHGKVMTFDTNVKPQNCNYAPLGQDIKVHVMPVENAWFDATQYHFNIFPNPCF